MDKIWKFQEVDSDISKQVMSYKAMPKIIADLLTIRGVTSQDDIENYYNVSKNSFHDPFLLSDMKEAVDRVLAARDKSEKIYIYGDYDVDGVTSTSILYMFLNECGCDCHYYIPDRHEEGYGINSEAISHLVEQEAKLMISVDTGITAVDQVNHANELGLDVIITDHHECQDQLPQSLAVINPKKPEDPYPFKQLAGVGVTFKLIQAIARTIGIENVIWKYLDIVAVGTVADIVPLYDENRVITKLAFDTMPTTWNQGLKALMKVSDIEGKKMTAGRIGFGIGPRLNAAGRIKHAKEAVELFTNPDFDTCMTIAEELNQVNQDRQALERKIFDEAIGIIDSTMEASEKHIIVVASKDWHHGVIGIVASRLVERYYRPVIILAVEDGVASGSARSVEGFSIFDALMSCKELFDKVGGHEMAAGMSLPFDRVEALDQALNDYGKQYMSEDTLIPKVKVDLKIDLSDVTIRLIEAIQDMEPFGIGNREPSFYMNDEVASIKRIGKDQSHLRVELGLQHKKQGIGFSMGDISDWLKEGQQAECVCTLDINEWQNRRSPQLMLKDLRYQEDVRNTMDNQLREHKLTDYLDNSYKATYRLTREDYGNLYKVLRELDRSKVWSISYGSLIKRVGHNNPENLTKILIMFEVLSELALISYELGEKNANFDVFEGKKVALEDSKLYNKFL